MPDIAEQIAARLKNRAAALRAGGEVLERAKDEAFAAEGPGWAPLAESTVERRGSAHPILRVTGRYRASFRAVYTDDSVALASDDWRFGVHQSGAGNVPARPVDLPESAIREACRAVAARLLRGGA